MDATISAPPSLPNEVRTSMIKIRVHELLDTAGMIARGELLKLATTSHLFLSATTAIVEQYVSQKIAVVKNEQKLHGQACDVGGGRAKEEDGSPCRYCGSRKTERETRRRVQATIDVAMGAAKVLHPLDKLSHELKWACKSDFSARKKAEKYTEMVELDFKSLNRMSKINRL